jgi:hypothetical protein
VSAGDHFAFVEVDLDVIDVVLGVFEDEFAVVVAKFTALFAWYSGPECAWRHDGVFGKHCPGGDDGAFADAAIIEDGDAHADEDGIFDNTAVDGGIVTDGDPVADGDGVEVSLAVEYAAVLNVGVGADADGMDIAAEDGIHPDRGALAKDDVAQNLGGDIDVATGGDDREFATVAADQGDLRKSLKLRVYANHTMRRAAQIQGGWNRAKSRSCSVLIRREPYEIVYLGSDFEIPVS